MTPGVIFLEEPTAEAFAKEIARRLGISDRLTFIPHEGKMALERSFPRKIPAWKHPPNARFVVVRDNDGADCCVLKQRLLGAIDHDWHARVKIRLVMQELESWYLGDPPAIEAAGFIKIGGARTIEAKAKFRSPETNLNAKKTFTDLVGRRSTVQIASAIGEHVRLENNPCASFNYFVDALRWAANGA